MSDEYEDYWLDDNPRVITRMGPFVYVDPQTNESSRRPPARALIDRFPVTTGFLVGAPTDVIARSIGRGDRWEIGLVKLAPSDTLVIWLLDLAIPYSRQIAAWRVA